MKILRFLICLFVTPAFSQTVNDVFIIPDSAKCGVLRISGEGYYLSTDLNSAFISKFTEGGFIDSTLKNDVFSPMKNEVRTGAEINYQVNYYANATQFFGLPHWGWTFGYGMYDNFNVSFSKNLFELIFFGNKGFAGDTVQLGPLRYQNTRFQKISIGSFRKDNFSSVSIGFINVQNYASYKMDQALFYTEANGLELDLALQESYISTDTTRLNFGSSNGWGLCTDLVFNLNTGTGKSARFDDAFRISLENFGFMRLNKNTLSHYRDTAIQYSGFEIESLNNFSSPFESNTLNDTLKFTYEKREITELFPFTFTVAKITTTDGSEKLQGFYGARLRARSNYNPMFYAGIQYNPNEKFLASVYTSVGGYGGFRFGLQAAGKIGKHTSFRIATGNIAGWFSKKAYGQDLNAGIVVSL